MEADVRAAAASGRRGAPAGNQNAAKPAGARVTEWLHMRVHPMDKAAWLAMATRRGLTLSRWVVEVLTAATK